MAMQLLVTAMMVASGLGTSGHNWMSEIPSSDDNIRVSELSIPGTHDSASIEGNAYVRTQDRSIYEQLKMGVRFLDLRVHMKEDDQGSDDPFTMWHGTAELDLTYEEVFRDIKKFLDENGQECIIARLKSENMEDNWDDRMRNAFLIEYLHPYVGYYLLDVGVPTLGACRGKMWIIQQSMGMAGTNAHPRELTINYGSSLIVKQDRYKIWSQTPSSNMYDQNDKKDDIHLFHRDKINGENLAHYYTYGECTRSSWVSGLHVGGCRRGYIPDGTNRCTYYEYPFWPSLWVKYKARGYIRKCKKMRNNTPRAANQVAINYYSGDISSGGSNPNMLSDQMNPLVFDLSGHFGISVFDFPTPNMIRHVFESQPNIGKWTELRNRGPDDLACMDRQFTSLGDAKNYCNGTDTCAYIFGPRWNLNLRSGSYSRNRFYTMRSERSCKSCPVKNSVPSYMAIFGYGSVWYRPGTTKAATTFNERGSCSFCYRHDDACIRSRGRRLEERLVSAEEITREEMPASLGAVELGEAEELTQAS